MLEESSIFDIVIVGGGAAGFFCAANAAARSPHLRIAIVEKTSKLLSKVKVSGGGRCNLTHNGLDLSELVQQYPRGQKLLRKAFHHFGTNDTIDWFESKGVSLKTEKDGRMFPQSNNSQSIIDCLIREINDYKVNIFLNADIVSLEKSGELWQLCSADGRNWYSKSICVTCGGFHKVSQYDWITRLGINIELPVPSLFTFNISDKILNALMGVSVPYGHAKIVGTKLHADGPILITHWGLSGPAILKLSAIGARLLAETQYNFSVLINWLEDETDESLREQWASIRNGQGNNLLSGHNPFGLPSRLWECLLNKAGITKNDKWSELKSAQQNKLIICLTADLYPVKGKTTFKEEFVTCGGIALSEIDVNTMQSRKCPGLYFAGEILDVDGVTGGYNFQNAWTTAWIAARSMAIQ